MSLASTERLLSHLVQHPMGAPTNTLGADLLAARAELARRGHRISTSDPDAATPRATAAAFETWFLHCAREHFSPQRFARARTSELGRFLHVWEHCDSTNGLAEEAARVEAAPHGALWLAEAQHRGRGRQGRRWSCPPHRGLLFSVLLRPPPHVRAPQLLPLAIALGVCEGLRRATGCNVNIKWPNDLFLDGRKLGGILVEARFATPSRVVVGCGLNVDVEPGSLVHDGVENATSLHAHTATLPEREVILADILAAVETRYDQWRQGQSEGILADWPCYDVLRDQSVRVQSAAQLLEGRARGVRSDGSLVVVTPDGTEHHFASAEVHLT